MKTTHYNWSRPSNKHLIPKMLKDGWSLDSVKQYMWILDDWSAVAECNKLASQTVTHSQQGSIEQ